MLNKVSYRIVSYRIVATQQGILLTNFGGPYCAQISPEACFRFSIHLSAIFPGKFLQTNVYWKILKKGSSSSSACNALNFFSVESLREKL